MWIFRLLSNYQCFLFLFRSKMWLRWNYIRNTIKYKVLLSLIVKYVWIFSRQNPPFESINHCFFFFDSIKMKWYFLFFLICFCALEILRLLPTGFREQQTNNFTKMAPDKALSLSLSLCVCVCVCVCVSECHRDTMTHSQCVSLCSLSLDVDMLGWSLSPCLCLFLSLRVIGSSLCRTQGSNELLGGN